MHRIQELIDNHRIIWFSIGSDEALGSRFLSEVAELGIPWVSGKTVTAADRCSYFMGIGPKPTLGHLSWQIWRATWLSEEADPEHRERFYSGGQIPLRVDYGAFSRGETDYLVRENVVKNVGGFAYPIGGRVIHIE